MTAATALNRTTRHRHVCRKLWPLATLMSIVFTPAHGWISPSTGATDRQHSTQAFSSSSSPSAASSLSLPSLQSVNDYKTALLQWGAALDRGQAYNPTSGDYYQDRMAAARATIEDFLTNHVSSNNVPTQLSQLKGEWELVLTTVPHGIFRSSPFFLAIQESYEYAAEKEAFGMPKADLFFKLHELQTCSWGASKVGRVAQQIDVGVSDDDSDNNKGTLSSEFDTSIFSLTVIPILGWFKLLPTFGGRVVTVSSCELKEDGLLAMRVQYTTARKVPGLNGLGEWIWKIKVPVGAIWKLLPWNGGREADCSVYVRYVDENFRIVQDGLGEYFVYARPMMSSSGTSL